jgi:hypothetical protein
MKFHIIILLWACANNTYGQLSFDKSSISKETLEIVREIVKVNMVMGSGVGYSGERPKQYDNFLLLCEKATNKELKELTGHPNATVRCYAFWALSYRDSTDIYPIVVKHLTDYETVETQFGCEGSTEFTGDFFIDYANEFTRRLDSIQLAKIDSILIYSDSKLRTKTEAIYRTNQRENLYHKIRQLALNGNGPALITLARYRKEEDVNLIADKLADPKADRNTLFYTYNAVFEFPDPNFLSLLEKKLQSSLQNKPCGAERELYRAIASYKNKKAEELLRLHLAQSNLVNREEHSRWVFGAVAAVKYPGYDELLWSLWTNQNMITPGVFEYLLAKDTERAVALSKASVLHPGALYTPDAYYVENDISTAQSVVKEMLELIMHRDPGFAVRAIRENFEKASVHLFPVFADKAIQIKDSSFVEPLLARLKKESNPNVYLKIVEVLLAYHNQGINQGILAARKVNEHLNTDWGGKALDKILLENNIR